MIREAGAGTRRCVPSGRMRSPYTAWGCGAARMAKAELSGTVTAFRQSKFKQDSYQTIVDIAKKDHGAKLVGARVVWHRKDGLQILGRVVASHGSKGAVRVRWDRGFPSQALGSQVKILAPGEPPVSAKSDRR